jgi:hypothetical protein
LSVADISICCSPVASARFTIAISNIFLYKKQSLILSFSHRKKAMLVIRAEQMRIFEQEALRQFEDEMMAHSKDFSPRLCEVIGDEQLRVAVRSAISCAIRYGFTNRGPIRLFVEMMFLRGSAFDTDPQFHKVGEALRASGDQMQRAERIHQDALDYLEKVSGPDAVNVRRALKGVLRLAQGGMRISSNGFEADMLQEMNTLFPQKVAYVGEKGLTALIREGRAEAEKYDFHSVRGEVLIVVLMFSFGHGCTNDPLYPWISRTLRDERIIDSAGRVARLEKKSLTWLEHVLSRNGKGASS